MIARRITVLVLKTLFILTAYTCCYVNSIKFCSKNSSRCDQLLCSFHSALSDYENCTLSHSHNTTVCLHCMPQYFRVLDEYKRLEEEKQQDVNVSCLAYFSPGSVNYISLLYSAATNVIWKQSSCDLSDPSHWSTITSRTYITQVSWVSAANSGVWFASLTAWINVCYNRYSPGPLAWFPFLNNVTIEAVKAYEQLQICFRRKINNTANICDLCLAAYRRLSEIIDLPNGGSVYLCVDVRTMVTTARVLWFNSFGCRSPHPITAIDDIIAYAIIMAICLLTVVFNVGSYIQGSRRIRFFRRYRQRTGSNASWRINNDAADDSNERRGTLG